MPVLRFINIKNTPRDVNTTHYAKNFLLSSAIVCFFVLSVSMIIQRLLHRFLQKSVERWRMGHGRKRQTLVVIGIELR